MDGAFRRQSCIGLALVLLLAHAAAARAERGLLEIRDVTYRVTDPERTREIERALAEKASVAAADERLRPSSYRYDRASRPPTAAELAAAAERTQEAARAMERRIWAATRGLTPVIEVVCYGAPGDQITATSRLRRATCATKDTYRVERIERDQAIVQHRQRFVCENQIDEVPAGRGQPYPYGTPKMGTLAGGTSRKRGIWIVSFSEVRFEPGEDHTKGCTVKDESDGTDGAVSERGR